MTTSFPSQRSRELHAALTGKKPLTPNSTQSDEDRAFLESRKGRFALWLNTGTGQASALAFGLGGVAVSIYSFLPLFAMVDGVSPSEAIAFSGALAGSLGGLVGMDRISHLEDDLKSAKPKPRDLKRELFESLKADLDEAGHVILDLSEEELTFTTQYGVVVVGEDKFGDLLVALNGSPLRASYESIGGEPKEFITSITGKKMPISSSPQIVT